MIQEKLTKIDADEIGDLHITNSYDTPLREDAFLLDDKTKIRLIEEYFGKIMHTLGLDLNDDSLKGTPYRVAKMYVKEIFKGLDPDNRPDLKVFENKYQYGEMLVEKNISLYSSCEHHFLPIIGKAHVGYIANDKVIGLSKINRIVDYFARRPQVQERLSRQISEELKRVLDTEDVAIVIESKHLCVASRGIQDTESSTVTAEYGGQFKDKDVRQEFLSYVHSKLE
ncbi:GTP cyclohydrolase I FolE [Microscilla marina]|uniref:GTP cyclohydrolase 1 n=1 Tax=Microscilla marina ATCC 23134 TaxID=313606 RepID=A1ZSS2_MICM2|nr:GTP cyclohydrolase I FolE [Microscilla marina]EAY26486.1 GTP cyclohydrolase I [Microscilla marina ATCC 23134]